MVGDLNTLKENDDITKAPNTMTIMVIRVTIIVQARLTCGEAVEYSVFPQYWVAVGAN